MMSLTTNSREHANRRQIIEELRQSKQMLLKQGVNSLGQTPIAIQSLPVNPPNPGTEHLSSIQRGAVLQAQSSMGYFISQDSQFGNVILPVLPRFQVMKKENDQVKKDIDQGKKEIDPVLPRFPAKKEITDQVKKENDAKNTFTGNS